MGSLLQPALIASTCALRWTVRLGMPHLGPHGLSEHWLLAHTGDLHWQLLSESIGSSSEHWKDDRGHRLYASFIAIDLQGALLSSAREGDVVEATSNLWLSGANRQVSRHLISSATTQQEVDVWMISSFVRREGTTNRGFVRVNPAIGLDTELGLPDPATGLLAHRRELRQHALDQQRDRGQAVLRVCATDDYNAIGMVYFANFPRLLDRAERIARFGEDAAYRRPLGPIRKRQCFYYGNADAGDEIQAEVIMDDPVGEVRLWHGASHRLLCLAKVVRDAARTGA